MTRIITENPTIEQIDQFEKSLAGDDPQWEGTAFGLNLRDILAYARDGLRERDRNFAQGQEMDDFILNAIVTTAYSHDKYCFCDICTDAKAMLPTEEYDGAEETNYALQLEGRAYGLHNPDLDGFSSFNEEMDVVDRIRNGLTVRSEHPDYY